MTPRRRRPAAAIWRFRGGLERVDHRCALTAVDRDDGGSLLSASPDPGVGNKHNSVTARDIMEGDGLEEELGTVVVLDDDGPWHTMLVHLPVEPHSNMYKLMQSKRGRNGERSVLWSATVALTSWQVMLFPKTSWTLSRSEAVKSLGSSPLQLHSILDKH
uniref:Uncharacterized protein n=1 Tax=Oryza glumipatula TaxID=40148 RepID=A0A0D9ZC17_9ORYZ